MQEHQIDRYIDIYFSHLFTTLGQMSAVAVSGIIGVPLYYYYNRINWYYNLNKVKKEM